MWRVGVLLAAACIILKNVYIPAREVESLRRSCCVSMSGVLGQDPLIVGVDE
jgi:hypothetical protein